MSRREALPEPLGDEDAAGGQVPGESGRPGNQGKAPESNQLGESDQLEMSPLGETYRRGPVILRGPMIPSDNTTGNLLKPGQPSDWLHQDPWRVLRIQAEFVDGFGALAELGPAVSVFGSARVNRTEPEYKAACLMGQRIAGHGIAVITGGGRASWRPRIAVPRSPEANRWGSASNCPTSRGSTSG